MEVDNSVPRSFSASVVFAGIADQENVPQVDCRCSEPYGVTFEIGWNESQEGKSILDLLKAARIAYRCFIIILRRQFDSLRAASDLPGNLQRQVIPAGFSGSGAAFLGDLIPKLP